MLADQSDDDDDDDGSLTDDIMVASLPGKRKARKSTAPKKLNPKTVAKKSNKSNKKENVPPKSAAKKTSEESEEPVEKSGNRAISRNSLPSGKRMSYCIK